MNAQKQEDRRVMLAREEVRRSGLDRELRQRQAAGGGDPAAVLLPVWDKVERALAVTGENTMDDLLWALRREEAVAFAEGGSVLIATGADLPAGRTLNLWIVAGTRKEVELLSRAAALYARDHGFERMTALTRPGIARWEIIDEDGWQKKAVFIEREV